MSSLLLEILIMVEILQLVLSEHFTLNQLLRLRSKRDNCGALRISLEESEYRFQPLCQFTTKIDRVVGRLPEIIHTGKCDCENSPCSRFPNYRCGTLTTNISISYTENPTQMVEKEFPIGCTCVGPIISSQAQDLEGPSISKK